MSAYEVLQIGAPDAWRDFFGGFTPESSRAGRRIVDMELPTQFIGLSANAYEPGESVDYWHRHNTMEELYVFLAGHGQMALDDDVVDVAPGTIVRVGQGVWRMWRCVPDSPEQLRWMCIRSGGGLLKDVSHDGDLDRDRPAPWA